MKKSIVVDTPDKIVIVAKICQSMLTERGKQEVIIQDYEMRRSIAQNRLMWKWNGEYAEYYGTSKDDAHLFFKEHVSVPIFTRDDAGYAAMVEAVKDVRRNGLNAQADALKSQILELTTTTAYSVKQMTEHLNEMEIIARDKGCIFTHPEDLYYDAMGIKR